MPESGWQARFVFHKGDLGRRENKNIGKKIGKVGGVDLDGG